MKGFRLISIKDKICNKGKRRNFPHDCMTACDLCICVYMCVYVSVRLCTHLDPPAGKSLPLFVFHDQLATRARLKSKLKSLSKRTTPKEANSCYTFT
jgi:hypothetical protein